MVVRVRNGAWPLAASMDRQVQWTSIDTEPTIEKNRGLIEWELTEYWRDRSRDRMATMNVNTTLVTVTVTRVHGYRRGLATAAVRLRYKTAPLDIGPTDRCLWRHRAGDWVRTDFNEPAYVLSSRFAGCVSAVRGSRHGTMLLYRVPCSTRHRPDGQSTVMTLCRKNSGSETTAATTKMITLTDKLCRTFTHRRIIWLCVLRPTQPSVHPG